MDGISIKAAALELASPPASDRHGYCIPLAGFTLGGHAMASASSAVIGSAKPAPHEQVTATVMKGVRRSNCSRPALMVYERAPWRS